MKKLLIFTLLVASAVFIACSGTTQTETAIENETETDASLKQLADAWKRNPIKAESDYFGQRFKVQGVVESINKKDGTIIVDLSVSGEYDCHCTFLFAEKKGQSTSEKDEKAVSALTVGERATISGRLTKNIKAGFRDGWEFMNAKVEKWSVRISK